MAPSVSFPETTTTRSSVMDSPPAWLVRGGMGAWLGLGITIAIGLIFYATPQMIPVFIGLFMVLVFTSILQPTVNLFVKAVLHYPTTFLTLLTTIDVIAGLVTYVATSIISQWSSLASQFGDGLNTTMDFLKNGPLHLTRQQIYHQLQLWLRQGRHYLQPNAPSLVPELLFNISTATDVFTILVLALFIAVFFLASGGRMWYWLLNELPATTRESTHRAADASWHIPAGYARDTVLVALTDAVVAEVFLQLVGIPSAAPLAVLVFIDAFIPIVGTPLAMLAAMVVVLAPGGFVTMIAVGMGVARIDQTEGHILQLLIMGHQVSLYPVVVIIGVTLGTYAADPPGMIIAVPLTSVLRSVYSGLHTKNAPVADKLPAYSSRKEWGAPLSVSIPAADARDTEKDLETVDHERDDSTALLHGTAHDESGDASADASVVAPHTGSVDDTEQINPILQVEEDHTGSSAGVLPAGDDANDAYPASMFLICQVGCAEYTIGDQ